jgi:hypothetical protein
MQLRKIVPPLLACVALGAFAASAARAAEGWTINGNALGSYEEISCNNHVNSKGEAKSPLLFTATLLGETVELSAEGIDCLERPEGLFDARIDNTISKGHSEITFTFTSVKVLKPSTKCTVGNVGRAWSGEITTSELTGKVIMDPTAGSTAVFDKFTPEVEGGAFATIEFLGPECSLSEDATSVKGSACGEAVHTNAGGTGFEASKTGELRVVQSLFFGKTLQETGGCTLEFGKKDAFLDGAIDFELSGFNEGEPFGAD